MTAGAWVFAVALVVAAYPAGAQPKNPEAQPDAALDAGPDAGPRPALQRLRRVLDAALHEVAPPSPFVFQGVSRGYQVPGEGAFIVLTPRSLPGKSRMWVFHTGRDGAQPHSRSPLPMPDFTTLTAPGDDELLQIAQQMEQMQLEAERARREANQAFERVQRQLHVRHGPQTRSVLAPADSAPPPWSSWFGVREQEHSADPAKQLSAVRRALTEALASQTTPTDFLIADGFLAVAVDFLPSGFLATATAPSRTLTVKVKTSDIKARREQKISAEEFAERVVFSEY